MATPGQKLADSLAALAALQQQGRVAVRSADLSRTHRERLLKGGFIREVMKGWYIPSRPDEERGDSTAWYAGFWNFCAAYLEHRFGEEWSLSPEQSLFLHTGNRSVPAQLLVRAPGARNRITALQHGCSLFETRAQPAPKGSRQVMDGLRLYSLPVALVASGPGFFTRNVTEARIALAMVRDAPDLLAPLLAGGHTTVAGRLAGGMRNIGRGDLADEIINTMQSAGYAARESDPFDGPALVQHAGRVVSPHVTRMHHAWQIMRETVIEVFPRRPAVVPGRNACLHSIDKVYVEDAYHSLSIEGYRVSRDLIERVRAGDWNPDVIAGDRDQRDAMVARGYFEAFGLVRQSIGRVLDGQNPGSVLEAEHGQWYRALFAPSVVAGIVRPADLAGYRNDQVFIRKSRHVPPRHDAVRDMMPELFRLLAGEPDSGVRAVLGHFMFVYIHPYMDGNGRMGRFLMNLMLASGGYPWTVIPVQRRDEYLAALEAASVDQDIRPFAGFLGGLVHAANWPAS